MYSAPSNIWSLILIRESATLHGQLILTAKKSVLIVSFPLIMYTCEDNFTSKANPVVFGEFVIS